MLKVRFFIKLSLQFRGIEAGNQGTNISRATSSRSDKSWKKDHGVGATISGDPLCAREAWRDMTVSLSRTLWRCRRTNAATKTCEAFTKRLRVPRAPRTHQRRSHYLMAPTYVFAVSRSLREQSDGAGDGSAANHFYPSPSASSFSFFPIFFYPASSFQSSCSHEDPRLFIPFPKLWIKDEEDDNSLW